MQKEISKKYSNPLYWKNKTVLIIGVNGFIGGNLSKKETIGEIDVQFMSHDKVTDRFGWSPSISLDSGIRNLIVWYKGYLENRYD
ncbi:hypothetical protein N9540_00415 [Gammaproteobacteria bacterium]|nr:hypothetical protein [Gammaproteobacteria bacterium]